MAVGDFTVTQTPYNTVTTIIPAGTNQIMCLSSSQGGAAQMVQTYDGAIYSDWGGNGTNYLPNNANMKLIATASNYFRFNALGAGYSGVACTVQIK